MKKWLYFLVGLIAMVLFFYFENNSIVTTQYTYSSNKIPKSFDGYKIVQLSDLHSKSFGKNQYNLIKKVEQVKPNLIVFTGDLVDANRYNEKNSLQLMERLVEIAPVYYVTGNHEWGSGKFDSLEPALIKIGVHVMRNTFEELAKGKGEIFLLGIDDPINKNESYSEQTITEERIRKLNDQIKNEGNFKILLSHRPELLSIYAKNNIDLVLSGHAHGGQFRVPFIGGFIAPNQGFFPRYTSDMHNRNHTSMIINRGLGNSIIPIRIFNRPEIVVVHLKKH